jgi:drug/metabolite transporter (DMT)-like permease
VFTTLFSVTWLGEALHLYHLVGFGLIVAGLIVVNLDRTAAAAKAVADRAAAGR